jgi:hypothetical protein
MRGSIAHALCALGFIIGGVAMFSPAVARPNPCKLVSRAEAARAMGEASSPAIVSTFRGNASCRYYNAAKTKNVFLRNVSFPEFASAKLSRSGKPVPVPGVGDEAFWMLGSLFVRKAGNYEQVSLYLSANSTIRMEPGLPSLSKLAASRM